MALFFFRRTGSLGVREARRNEVERVMNDEPVPHGAEENVVVCEPAQAEDADDSSQDPSVDADPWLLEEEGYGYGV